MIERPKTYVQWLLGNSCNYKCSYCHHGFYDGTHRFPDNEKLLSICKDIIFHYDSLDRDVVFEFIGGEPTLLDKLPSLGQRLHNHPVNIVIKTNGSAPLDWWKSMRKNLAGVVISIHREFCDLDHIVNVIDLLLNNKDYNYVNVEVLIPVTNRPESWDWGVKTLKLIRKKFDLGNLQLLYSNFGKGSNQFLPYKSSQLEEYQKLSGISLNVHDDGISRQVPNFFDKECYCGVDTLVIDHLGDIYRGWCKQDGLIGNINDQEINFPQSSIICKKDLCGNGFDQQARKI
jgi:MoaA/NifB/PqqE/SkfB family radical SAM enzyme